MRIETARLVLRDFVAADERAMHAIRRDPSFLGFYDEARGTAEETHRLQEMFLEYQRAEPRRRFQLAITLRGNDTPIGSAGIRRKDANEFDADIGYELQVQHWGHGYATEAARALVDYGFQWLGLSRLSSCCIADNERSARVLEAPRHAPSRGGCGRTSSFAGVGGTRCLYGLLRGEWEAQRDTRDSA
jgi:ribosomal-protein-alanine N-acetyltransferase